MDHPKQVSPRSHNRRRQLLDAAAHLFTSSGYAGTSIRDIATMVGMLPGSIYYHFKSKEELLLAVHEEGVSNIFQSVRTALEQSDDDPWSRLEAACRAHLNALCSSSHYAMIVTPEFLRGFEGDLRAQIIAQRDRYEDMFRKLIDDLPLADDVNPNYLRLGLLGSLNWVTTWYRPGTDTLDNIAVALVNMFRRGLDPRQT